MTYLVEDIVQNLNLNHNIRYKILQKYKQLTYYYDKIGDIKCLNCHTILDVILFHFDICFDDGSWESYMDDNYYITNFDDDVITLYCAKCQSYYMGCCNCNVKLNDNILEYVDDRDTYLKIIRKRGPIHLCKFLGFAGFHKYDGSRIIKPNIPISTYCKEAMEKYSNMDGSDDYECTINDEFRETILEEWSLSELIKYPDETINSEYLIPYYVGNDDLMYFSARGVLPTGPGGGYYHFWKCLNCNKIYDLTDQ